MRGIHGFDRLNFRAQQSAHDFAKAVAPSLIGKISSVSCGRALLQLRAMAHAAAPAVSVPLNLSGVIRIFSGMALIFGGLIFIAS